MVKNKDHNFLITRPSPIIGKVIRHSVEPIQEHFSYRWFLSTEYLSTPGYIPIAFNMCKISGRKKINRKNNCIALIYINVLNRIKYKFLNNLKKKKSILDIHIIQFLPNQISICHRLVAVSFLLSGLLHNKL